MKSFASHILLLAVLGTLSACVGSGEGGKQKADCQPGQTFNSVSRSCQGAAIVESPPTPTLGAISLPEDAGPTDVELRYNDQNGDPAESCRVVSLSDGIRKSRDIQGVRFTSKSNLTSGHNLFVRYSLAGAISSSISTVGSITTVTINHTVSSQSSDIYNYINATPAILNFFDIQFIALQTVVPTSGALQLDGSPCTCAGGKCYGKITPVDNYSGTTDFTYWLTDNDGESVSRTVPLNITEINDLPTISPGTASFAVTEINVGTSAVNQAIVGNIATDFGLTITDVEDPSLVFLTYELVTGPTLGTFSLSSNGIYSYQPPNHAPTGQESIAIRVRDWAGQTSTLANLTFLITGADDAPIANALALSSVAEDSARIVDLTYSDAEGHLATVCEVTYVSKLYVSTPCACAAGLCSVGITGRAFETGAAEFRYRVTANGLTSTEASVTYTLSGSNDAPFAFSVAVTDLGTVDADGMITFDESSTYVPETKSFTLKSAIDPEGQTVSYREVDITLPTRGTLANCMGLDGSATDDITCDYTPYDGNINGEGTRASVAVSGGDMLVEGKTAGTFFNGVSIQLISATGTPTGIPYAWAEGSSVKVLVIPGTTTVSAVVTAINGSSTASGLVRASTISDDPVVAVASTLLSGGTDGADKFSYRATDSSSLSSNVVTVHINIVPVDDAPTICAYSKFSQAPECGLNGCIGNFSPTGMITPAVSGLYYYDTVAGACWKSNLSLSAQWELSPSHIGNQTINEKDEVVIDEIKIDEGGGDVTEDSDELSITAVTSSNGILVPTTNIAFYYNDSLVGNGGTLPVNIGDAAANASDGNFKIVVVPVGGESGSSTITLTMRDGVAPAGQTVDVSFVVTVNNVSAQHGGWTNIKALGPKTNKNGQLVNTTKVCNYSQALCEGSNACTGVVNPVGSSVADPDHIDAIFWNSATDTCYYQDISQLEVTFQGLGFTAKRAGGASIRYVDGATLLAEVVNVSGTQITVYIQDGGSTAGNVQTAIENNAIASALVSITSSTPGVIVSTQALTALPGPSNALWTELPLTCNVSPQALEPGCDNATLGLCVGLADPNGVIQATKLDSYYSDISNGTCYRSIDTGTANDWEAYVAPGEVTLSWNAFTVSGSGSISGYNVYRRLKGEINFDFDRPLNRNAISSGTLTYVDNVKNSIFAPIPNTVYEYEVRPIINGIATGTNQVFKIARVLVPPPNMAFAHRWIINKEMCSTMHSTSIDPNNHYRCSYYGPGNTLSGGAGYYDIGTDLVVDQFEAGCAYTAAPACSTYDGACIGIDAPNGSISATTGNIYYDRTEGKCWVSGGGTAWTEIVGATGMSNYNVAQLPPLTNVTQSTAAAFCAARPAVSGVLGTDSSDAAIAVAKRLPSRKHQMAYSLWDSSVLTDSNIAVTETGLSLNSSSKCNSSGASGLESGYTDVDSPDSNVLYSRPGTATSNIRSLITGSSQTAACVGRFGIQDVVGNVAEWVTDRVSCGTLSTCTAATPIIGGTSDMSVATPGADAYSAWAANGLRGPCVDANGDTVCDSAMTSWEFEEERYGAGRMFTPMGLPAHVDFPLLNPLSLVNPYMLEIGPTSGVTALKLHDDVLAMNSHHLFAGTSGSGGMTTGGHYTSGGGAGAYAFQLHPDANDVRGYLTLQDVSYILVSTTIPATGVTIQYANLGCGGGDAVLATVVAGVSADIQIDLDCSSVPATIALSVNTDPVVNLIIGAELTGNAASAQAPMVAELPMIDLTSEAKASSVKVGLRCVAPVSIQ
jgi:VCBS repeat-containing protein